ncbi:MULTISPECIES: hypothetical protein [unclassified Agarivorans]|nr:MULTISPECIES: hypothetical protein [unclassified Agarivorans]MDO6684843.1 hypothetical protein [Agarivorans sp. 3_MG-2023]MDO6714996.1 hypothetical protein [Agarivorans sp. 2_MG-2023]MDO6764084.1 hypothetical protein [Agarivorans sp. 1_MG-2023]
MLPILNGLVVLLMVIVAMYLMIRKVVQGLVVLPVALSANTQEEKITS